MKLFITKHCNNFALPKKNDRSKQAAPVEKTNTEDLIINNNSLTVAQCTFDGCQSASYDVLSS